MKFRCWILAVFLVLPLQVLPAAAQNQIHDVDITVELATDGSAKIHEVWNMTLSRGTEVYLGRDNLGDIKILDLTVSDETGTTYHTDRYWDVDRSFEKKRNHCGLNSTSGGYEICWGIGEYGRRTYTVDYTLTHLVKSLDDYDMIHYQFYTENDFGAEHVKVTIEKPGYEIDTLTRVWAFGYDGYIWREDGKVYVENETPLASNHTVIVLMRFDKGIFAPESVQERPFQDVLDRALDGADKPDVPLTRAEEIFYTVIGVLFFLGMCLLPFVPLVIAIVAKRRKKKNTFGMLNLKQIGWSREVPYGGDILMNYYVISTTPDLKTRKNSVAAAMILHMLQEGCLDASGSLATGKVDIRFNPDSSGFRRLYHTEETLWKYMYEASGPNKVLEEKEFSTWAKSHTSTLYKWTNSVQSDGLSLLRNKGYYLTGTYTPNGQAENRKIIGFRKFLEDTTLIRQRTTPEVTLWREYLIFASLIGIADKVAKELKDINPVVFQEACTMAYNDMTHVIYISNAFSDTLSRFATPPASSYSGGSSLGGFSRSGGGGHSSFGGGGGFSGGGHSGVR